MGDKVLDCLQYFNFFLEGRKLVGEFTAVSEKIFHNCLNHRGQLFLKVSINYGEKIKIKNNGIGELTHLWSRLGICKMLPGRIFRK